MPPLCPCGSQLELSNCCISEEIALLKHDCITKLACPERVTWAIEYIKQKTVQNEYILTEQEAYAESIGEKITCLKKCSTCCVEFISARLEECDAIVIYLYLYPKLMNQFLTNFDAWYNNITSDGDVLSETSDAYQKAFETRSAEDKKRFESMALTYARKHARCPFLRDDLCMIYPIRPYTCSTYAVITDKKYCAPDLAEEVYIKHKQKVRSSVNPLQFDDQYVDLKYYLDLKGCLLFGPMPTLIHQMLLQGPTLNDSILHEN